MRLKQYYLECMDQLQFEQDADQVLIVDRLDELSQLLSTEPKPASLLDRILSRSEAPAIRGIYLWGGVGRGKTWLMDLFFDSLPGKQKLRLHFHRFMKMIHDELLDSKGERDPLKIIADRLAERYKVICLDEFHVSDITDAMLLSGLLTSLFDSGITLVVTSNMHPDDLYAHGLQRDRFLPAIELIKAHVDPVNIPGRTDHRLRNMERTGHYYTPLNARNDQAFAELFDKYAESEISRDIQVKVDNRFINVRASDGYIVWFDFGELCGTARSARDYIEMAQRYNTVFVSNVPAMSDAEDDKARRFVNMIDEFYDKSIRLVISAATPPSELYQGRRLQFEFVRTTSRLQEMRSHEYLARSSASR